jgi:hypothetical protein
MEGGMHESARIFWRETPKTSLNELKLRLSGSEYSGKNWNSHKTRETRLEKKKFPKIAIWLSEYPNLIPALLENRYDRCRISTTGICTTVQWNSVTPPQNRGVFGVFFTPRPNTASYLRPFFVRVFFDLFDRDCKISHQLPGSGCQSPIVHMVSIGSTR